MDASRHLECLAEDYSDLRDAVASVEVSATVPSCPGWTVADLVVHVAQVYLHKAAIMQTGEEPDPWPPPGLAAGSALPLLGRAYGELRAQFRAHEPGEEVPTWFGPDQTVADAGLHRAGVAGRLRGNEGWLPGRRRRPRRDRARGGPAGLDRPPVAARDRGGGRRPRRPPGADRRPAGRRAALAVGPGRRRRRPVDGDPAWADYLRRLLAVVTQ